MQTVNGITESTQLRKVGTPIPEIPAGFIPSFSSPHLEKNGVDKIPAVLIGSQAIVSSIVDERLPLEAFFQLAGTLAGYSFVKVVVDRDESKIHFINHSRYEFHSDYIAENILGKTAAEVDADIEVFNESVYLSMSRRFYLGILALHKPIEKGQERRFFSLETVEIDTMDSEMLKFFYGRVKEFTDPSLPLYFKPANHNQEKIIAGIDSVELPRIFSHELFASSRFIALNSGVAQGRLRAFKTELEYRRALPTIEWHDIIVMHRVPDDIPRISGIINAHHTTPLSHTNVLATGWNIPNAIQLGIFDQIAKEGLADQWVSYGVDLSAQSVSLTPIEKPAEVNQRPAWIMQQVKLEEPETINTPILELDRLRMSDRYRYGTKAANLGELRHVLENGSERLLGFYKVNRPPRKNLMPHLAKFLGVDEAGNLTRAAWQFLRNKVEIPRGIAIPFSVQQEFLESSPRIQQAIGKLKMAQELNARETDSLCLMVQQLIRTTRMPERVRSYIDAQIANHLSGVSSFVVRSSSNAEDLENFSAAGIYESINHVTTAENIFQSIKEVWASLLSPRSVRLRHQVGISLDDCYMGVIVQEEVKAEMGGVLVTTNPTNRADFRNVYINVSANSSKTSQAPGAKSGVNSIVDGSELPHQLLFNTVEGGGRTLTIGDNSQELNEAQKAMLQDLAFAGRLLQSHFSPDYTFSAPVDIEWVAGKDGISILQLRPYSK
ncbi:MAG: phosphoenolpyruvate synthase [Methylotenera sp.]|nr:phosphoenolpyruvate synthase [Oligoflexia bacterium]